MFLFLPLPSLHPSAAQLSPGGWGSISAPGSLVLFREEGRKGLLAQVRRAMETQMLAGPLGGPQEEGHQALKAEPS